MSQTTTTEWGSAESPFVFDRPVPPAQVVGRDAEMRGLREYHEAGRAVMLAAPRRYGKTSLLHALAERLQGEGTPVVVVDLYAVHSLVDLTVRLERAYRRWVTGPVRDTVANLLEVAQVGLSLGPVSVQPARPDARRVDAALHVAADLPRAIMERHGRRVWMVLDEFQSIFAVPHAEGLLRTYVQQHGDVASYVFAGPQGSLLEAMFTDQARPFYAQADRKALAPLADGPLGALILRLFGDTGRHPGDQLVPLLALAAGHPQRAMLLAHHLWRATRKGRPALEADWLSARDAVLEVTAPECQTRFDAMTANRQRAVRAMAVHGSPYGRAARQEVGAASSSISTALTQLVADGDVEQHGPGDWRFIDPLLPEWIRRRYRAA